MDCSFLLAEELDRRYMVNEAFSLMSSVTREEKRRPYFRHFMVDVEGFRRKLDKKLRQSERCRTKQYAHL
jgi:hypothetical protein